MSGVQYFAIYRESTGKIEQVGRSTSKNKMVVQRGRNVAYSRRPFRVGAEIIRGGQRARLQPMPFVLTDHGKEVEVKLPPGATSLFFPAKGDAVRIPKSSRRRKYRFAHPDFAVTTVVVQPLHRPVRHSNAST